MSLTPAQIETIQTTFEALAPQADDIIARFYERLFENHPEVRPLFPDDMTAQRAHLKSAVALVAKNADRFAELEGSLSEMGARHVGYGARPEHYPVVRDELLAALAETAGQAWTPDVEDAWTAALNAVASAMIAGAEGASAAA